MYHAITTEAVSVTLTHEGKAGRCAHAAGPVSRKR